MPVIAIAAVGFAGLLIGSFLNVVSYRVPLGISVLRPPSACPGCGHPIQARDNIPVLSWLWLRGRCRWCRMRIAVRYPLVEAGTAVLFAATAGIIGPRWVLPAHLWFVGVSVALVITDFDHRRIPNRILYPGTVVALVLLAAGSGADGDWPAMVRSLAGGATYFMLLLGIAVAARGGFGFGDVKLGFLLGLFAAHRSWTALVVSVFLAFVIGGLMSIVLLVLRRAGRRDTIPFGPSMVLGAFLAIACGDIIGAWYLG